ncbi:MAG: type II toxin-antitoxin system VapC family toxin [Thiofilum sp.]|uniref:type II toxin-antitoxin system VapC family toxin n=1 Tax=Thiofilum sp. TaxID=2212733 RepID=UPI0025F77466|nr:type II toxin-antitoxin system VapC family toxin [Thiofilum sp.]MBK8454192.1 type II toxin-antitoxin system VapC family toxin [Thiofilum sp.]
MILLDTNIISELMRPKPQPAVVQWLNNQDALDVYISVITIAEIEYGLKILPEGQKRWGLKQKFDWLIAQGFSERVLDFTAEAALHYADIMAYRRSLGLPMSVPDGQIAALARLKRFTLATRNVKDFEECGLMLVNPFSIV